MIATTSAPQSTSRDFLKAARFVLDQVTDLDQVLTVEKDTQDNLLGKFRIGRQVYDYIISPEDMVTFTESRLRSDSYLAGYYLHEFFPDIYLDAEDAYTQGVVLGKLTRLDKFRNNSQKKQKKCKKGIRCKNTCIAKGLDCANQGLNPKGKQVAQRLRNAMSSKPNPAINAALTVAATALVVGGVSMAASRSRNRREEEYASPVPEPQPAAQSFFARHRSAVIAVGGTSTALGGAVAAGYALRRKKASGQPESGEEKLPGEQIDETTNRIQENVAIGRQQREELDNLTDPNKVPSPAATGKTIPSVEINFPPPPPEVNGSSPPIPVFEVERSSPGSPAKISYEQGLREQAARSEKTHEALTEYTRALEKANQYLSDAKAEAESLRDPLEQAASRGVPPAPPDQVDKPLMEEINERVKQIAQAELKKNTQRQENIQNVQQQVQQEISNTRQTAQRVAQQRTETPAPAPAPPVVSPAPDPVPPRTTQPGADPLPSPQVEGESKVQPRQLVEVPAPITPPSSKYLSRYEDGKASIRGTAKSNYEAMVRTETYSDPAKGIENIRKAQERIRKEHKEETDHEIQTAADSAHQELRAIYHNAIAPKQIELEAIRQIERAIEDGKQVNPEFLKAATNKSGKTLKWGEVFKDPKSTPKQRASQLKSRREALGKAIQTQEEYHNARVKKLDATLEKEATKLRAAREKAMDDALALANKRYEGGIVAMSDKQFDEQLDQIERQAELTVAYGEESPRKGTIKEVAERKVASIKKIKDTELKAEIDAGKPKQEPTNKSGAKNASAPKAVPATVEGGAPVATTPIQKLAMEREQYAKDVQQLRIQKAGITGLEQTYERLISEAPSEREKANYRKQLEQQIQAVADRETSLGRKAEQINKQLESLDDVGKGKYIHERARVQLADLDQRRQQSERDLEELADDDRQVGLYKKAMSEAIAKTSDRGKKAEYIRKIREAEAEYRSKEERIFAEKAKVDKEYAKKQKLVEDLDLTYQLYMEEYKSDEKIKDKKEFLNEMQEIQNRHEPKKKGETVTGQSARLPGPTADKLAETDNATLRMRERAEQVVVSATVKTKERAEQILASNPMLLKSEAFAQAGEEVADWMADEIEKETDPKKKALFMKMVEDFSSGGGKAAVKKSKEIEQTSSGNSRDIATVQTEELVRQEMRPRIGAKSALVDVVLIKNSTPSGYSPQDVERLADSVTDTGLVRPILVERTDLQEYKPLPGYELEYESAKRARQKDPQKNEMIESYVVRTKEQIAVVRKQQQLLAQAVHPRIEVPTIEELKERYSVDYHLQERPHDGLDNVQLITPANKTSSAKYPDHLIDELADTILEVGLTEPIAVRQTGLDSYEAIPGYELHLLAAKRAREKNPLRGEMVNMLIAKTHQQHQNMLHQMAIVQQLKAQKEQLLAEAGLGGKAARKK